MRDVRILVDVCPLSQFDLPLSSRRHVHMEWREFGCTPGIKDFITDQLAKEIVAPDSYQAYRFDEMVETGLPGVRTKYRRRHLKYLKHSWTAIKGLIGLFAVLIGMR